MYREITVAASEIGADALRLARTSEPLGAYASSGDITYVFAAGGDVLGLRAARESADAVQTAASASLPLFDWHEREMRDRAGVRFDGLLNARTSMISGSTVPAALTAEGKGVSVIVVGPVHAGIIEPGRFTFSSGGETVVHLDAQLSYGRRGVEARLTGGDALAASPRLARVCGACSAARSWAYARALETLAGVACDERSEWARVAVAELERISNHIFDLASASAAAGYGHGQLHGLALKERTHRLCAAASGHRLLFDAIVPGGVRAGILADPAAVRTEASVLSSDVAAYLQGLFATRSLMRRFAGTGHVAPATARAFGAAGPARRACGDGFDVRRDVPYGAYRSAPPAAVCETSGDVAARCAVKRREIGDSFALVDRALRGLDGHAPPPPLDVHVSAGSVTTVVEGPRGAESVSLTCGGRGEIAHIHLISASYRNWPVVLRAMEGNIVPDFPLVNKSFNLCYACADR